MRLFFRSPRLASISLHTGTCRSEWKLNLTTLTMLQGVRGVGFVSGGYRAVLRGVISTALMHVSDW